VVDEYAITVPATALQQIAPKRIRSLQEQNAETEYAMDAWYADDACFCPQC